MDQKKAPLVQRLVAQPEVLRSGLLERQWRPLWDPTTRKFTGIDWMRTAGVKTCEEWLKLISL